MKEYNHEKLIKFLENIENKTLIIYSFTIITYLILCYCIRNTFVLFFGYFVAYVFYSKIYNKVVIRIKLFLMKKADKDLL